MGLWSIVVPDSKAITNLVVNPSVEASTLNYTAVGASIARVIGTARRGAYSLTVTPTSGAYDGVYYSPIAFVGDQPYVFSVDIKGQAGVPYRIYFANSSGTLQGTAKEFVATGNWERHSVQYTPGLTSINNRLYITKNNSASTAPFYVDGLLCVNSAYDVTYFDGDSEHCHWDGTSHRSTSTTEPEARRIGQVVNLDNLNIFVKEVSGAGMVESKHQVSQRSLLPGAEYLGARAVPRSLLLSMGALASSQSEQHSRRSVLINAVKHDLTPGDEPLALRYNGGNNEVELRCVVDREISKLLIPTWQDIALSLTAYDPYFYDTADSALSLITQDSATLRYLAAKIDKMWNSGITPSAVTNPGTGISVLAIAITYKNVPSGSNVGFSYPKQIWVGGSFLNWNGDANADYIAYYDFDDNRWYAAGSGMNGLVQDIVIGADGKVYACGEFTTAGGVSANRIAVWNGSNWSALGTGLNLAGRCMVFGQDGYLYVGGEFTTAGGVTVNYFARWTGSAWQSLSSTLNGPVLGMALAPNGDIYLTGGFTTIGLTRICKWNGSTYTGLGTGLNGQGMPIVVAPNGDVYVGGQFTTADGVSCSKIARWNGQTFTPLGSGLSGGDCYNLAFDQNGVLYASGNFTSAGGLATASRLAAWNGSSWVNLDITLPGTPIGTGLATYRGDIFIGFGTSGTATYSKTDLYTNTGTARVHPRLVIKRSGGTSAKLVFLKNETTGATLWFDLALQDSEVVIVDFSEGKRKVLSSIYGNIWNKVLRGSEFAEFYLLPGDNLLSLYVQQSGSPTITAYLQWVNRYESIDGSA